MAAGAERRILAPEGLPEPRGFSHGVETNGGRIVWLAGQNGTDAEGRVVEGGLVEQTDRALANIIAVVEAAGGRATDIVKLHLYVSDVAAYRGARRALGEVWRARFGRHYPAMMLLGVTGFFEAEALVEIDGYAVIDALDGPSGGDRTPDGAA